MLSPAHKCKLATVLAFLEQEVRLLKAKVEILVLYLLFRAGHDYARMALEQPPDCPVTTVSSKEKPAGEAGSLD